MKLSKSLVSAMGMMLFQATESEASLFAAPFSSVTDVEWTA